jgi:N-acetyl-gamma-glutamyl-phosphate reductase common form
VSEPVPCLVLGGTGYVSGELLRLLAVHPHLEVAGVVSLSRPGDAVEAVFPHLEGAYPGRRFDGRESLAALLRTAPRMAAFSAGPHGESAGEIDALLSAAEAAGTELRLVDLSADFRFPDAAEYRAVYGVDHGAPERLGSFVCAVPEHAPAALATHACQPGCFTTAVTLPLVGLLAQRLIEPVVHVSAVTGSTGAGRVPRETTHHPERQSNLFAYGPLAHRHEPEMVRLAAAATGITPEVNFVPHSGPFARGIHATLHATLARPADAATVAAALADHYRDAPFVRVGEEPPRLKQVVGTNRCRLGVAARDRRLVVLSVIDNLVKGAAGGAVQWMNKLLGFEETAGLEQPGLGWI